MKSKLIDGGIFRTHAKSAEQPSAFGTTTEADANAALEKTREHYRAGTNPVQALLEKHVAALNRLVKTKAGINEAIRREMAKIEVLREALGVVPQRKRGPKPKLD